MLENNKFYLGRATGDDPQPIHYDPRDLTTHAVVTGMTGSGKTGLCIALMEEAALQGIPAIIIDPKGDLTNLLLHFPNLAPDDFKPWLDEESARRAGKSLEQAAQETSEQWRKGLSEWGIGPERMNALANAAEFAIFTPGSDAGIPVSVLASLEAPSLAWQGNAEVLRERIASAVTAILGLVGFNDVDPLRSREHILLANIFEQAWSEGKSLSLNDLIHQTKRPPFEHLGALALETFFPEKDRVSLAMSLNNILASPTFQSWRDGTPLNIAEMLRSPQRTPAPQHLLPCPPQRARAHVLRHPAPLRRRNLDAHPEQAHPPCGRWSISMKLSATFRPSATRPPKTSSSAC
jgi:hypothetical protein